MQRDNRAFETWLDPTTRKQKEFVDSVVRKVRAVYVHTVHLAEHVLDWLASGKIIVDIHGTVPEEEETLGRPDRAAIYAPIEAAVLTRLSGFDPRFKIFRPVSS